MKISMIAAMAKNRVIGANNAMPWHLPADLRHFKAITLGKPVIMGRKTYESIGRALPGRQNIVISRSGFDAADATVVVDGAAALDAAENTDEVMIIGGGKIYEMFLPKAECLYLTFIDLDIAGDTHFPDYRDGADWREVSRAVHQADDKNAYNLEFVTFLRV